MKQKKDQILKDLQNLGIKVYHQLESGGFPWVDVPSRSISNIIYDPASRQYILGDKSTRRSARNIRHLRPLTQLIWTASMAKKLNQENKTSTLRDVFYMAQAFNVPFKDQQESDNIITELETDVPHAREDFNIFPEERSAIFGDLTIEYTVPGYEGKQLNLTLHPDGVMIGPALATAELVRAEAECIVCIEKGAMFTRLVEEKAWQKFKALLIHTAGQPPRSTRALIRRLNQELDLPVYVFCDADPWGVGIALTVICGSANAAHLRELVTPDAVWMGLYPTDVQKYKLPTEPMNDVDVKRVHELLDDPRCQSEPWQRELKQFKKIKRKCELEAFSRYGLTFVVDKYLPDKMKEVAS